MGTPLVTSPLDFILTLNTGLLPVSYPCVCSIYGLTFHSIRYSPYYYGMDEIAKSRYRQKLVNLGGIDDPYLAEPDSIVGDCSCYLSTYKTNTKREMVLS